MDRTLPVTRLAAATAALVGAFVAAAVPAGAQTPTERPAAANPATVETIRGRDGSTHTAEHWHLDVPANRAAAGDGGADPDATISLGVMRVPAVVDDPGPPVFMLAGGPGGPSIEMVRRHVIGGGTMFLRLLGADVIAIDQRGVGTSRPNLDSETRWDVPVDEPGDPVRLLAHHRRVASAEAARWLERGVDLTGYTTAESADDIDAVRRFLGYEKITLWGASYGSHLALATIRRHGAHVARAVLIGPEGPDHTIKLPSYTQDGLERVARLVAEDPQLGDAIPDLVALVGDVLSDLEAEPRTVDVDGSSVGISAFDVRCQLAHALGSVRGGIEELPAAVHAMAGGDFEQVARELLSERRDGTVRTAMLWIMDHASGVTAERAARIEQEAATCLLGDAINFPFPQLAEAWGAPDLGDAFRGPLRSDVPVLFLVGDLDSRTPIRNAEELIDGGLSNAHLIVVENAGHDLNWVQKELRDAWSAFLAGRSVDTTRVVAPKPRFRPLNR